MGTALTILKGVAQLIGLGDALERWLERSRAQAAGRAEQAAADNTQSLKEATDAQHDQARLSGVDRNALLDSLSAPAGPTADK